MTFGSLFSGCGLMDLGIESAGLKCLFQCEIDPDARRVLAHHWPNVPCHEDVRTVGKHNLPRVDVLVGGFPCFAAGTLILTEKGLVPIETVSVGDKVLTHQGRWRSVTAAMSRHAEKTLTMKGGFHPGLVTTEEHPFWSSRGRVRRYHPQSERCRGHWHGIDFDAPAWVGASSMEGRYWSSPVISGEADPPEVPSIRQVNGQGHLSVAPPMSEAMFWVLGAWLGDGWVRRRKDRNNGVSAIIICCPESETNDLIKRVNDAGLRATVSPDRTVNKLIVSHRALSSWIVSQFGEKCDGKRIPGWLFTCKEVYRRAFLQGYLWADGCDRERDGWSATTVCRPLAFGIGLLGVSLGYVVSVYHIKMPPLCEIEGRKCNQKDQYSIIGRSFQKQTSAFRLGLHLFTKCRAVVPSGPAKVFNISVDEDESYVADGIVVHNCQDLSVAGQRAGIQKGERSGLFYEMTRIAYELQPRILVWENVLGLLSSFTAVNPPPTDAPEGSEWEMDEDSDFEAVLCELQRIGFHGGWTSLDARWFGVAQRRRRVFGVFVRRDIDARCAAEILALSHRGAWDSAQGGKAGAKTAATLRSRSASAGVNRPGRGGEDDQNLVIPIDMRQASRGGKMTNNRGKGVSSGGAPGTGIGEIGDPCPSFAGTHTPVVAGTLNFGNRPGGFRTEPGEHLVARCKTPGEGNRLDGDSCSFIGFTLSSDPNNWIEDAMPPITGRHGDPGNVAQIFETRIGRNGRGQPSDVAHAKRGHEAGGSCDSRPMLLAPGMMVRRLTPTECLRLMGAPDDFLDLDPPLSDSAKYRLLGNGVVVNVARWLGKRILEATQ